MLLPVGLLQDPAGWFAHDTVFGAGGGYSALRVAALLDALNALTREIRVTENSSTLGVLKVPAGPSTSEHKNKYGMDYEPPAPNSPAYERR